MEENEGLTATRMVGMKESMTQLKKTLAEFENKLRAVNTPVFSTLSCTARYGSEQQTINRTTKFCRKYF